jgi:hypothetical protein
MNWRNATQYLSHRGVHEIVYGFGGPRENCLVLINLSIAKHQSCVSPTGLTNFANSVTDRSVCVSLRPFYHVKDIYHYHEYHDGYHMRSSTVYISTAPDFIAGL